MNGVEEGFVPDPDNSIAVVAEDQGKIVGRMFLVAMPHIEGTWIHPDKRNGTIAYRLEKAMSEEAKRRGIPMLLAYVPTPEVAGYMQRLGYKREPYIVLSKEVKCQ